MKEKWTITEEFDWEKTWDPLEDMFQEVDVDEAKKVSRNRSVWHSILSDYQIRDTMWS